LDVADAAADPDWAWRTAAGDTPEELYGLWRRAVEHSRAAMAKALADGGLHQPAKYTTSDGGTSPNLRRIVVDLHDEYARHVGHADLLREALDGLVGRPAAVTATGMTASMRRSSRGRPHRPRGRGLEGDLQDVFSAARPDPGRCQRLKWSQGRR
jgi:hypothetical protein